MGDESIAFCVAAQAKYFISFNRTDRSENEFIGSGFGVTIFTPLSQTNFFPDLMHVKVLPETTEVKPAVLQVDPALTAAFAGIKPVEIAKTNDIKEARSFLFIKNKLVSFFD
jgi:hypothetical protein